MPVTPARRRLAIAVLCALGGTLHAQSLPRRDNVESALVGDVDHSVARDRHVARVTAGGRSVLDIDAGGRVVDIENVAGDLPAVLASQGGALFVDAREASVAGREHVFDTAGDGARWLMLDGTPGDADAIVHVRHPREAGGADPWRVPLAPTAPQSVRTRADRRDHAIRIGDGAIVFHPRGATVLRLDSWRVQTPSLLPPDATWLRVEADGRVVHDARLPTPPARERLWSVDGRDVVLDLAGRVRVDIPAGTREIRVYGEPGTWLRALAPLPGTPTDALAVTTDPARDRLVQPASGDRAVVFEDALARFPDAVAQAWLARFAYFRDAVVVPSDASTLVSRTWRVRAPDRTDRRTAATNRPADDAMTVAPTLFHWLPPQGRWRIDPTVRSRSGQLRLSVAHAGDAPLELELQQDGVPARRLRLEPAAVRALRDASSDADVLLAADRDPAAVVDASQVTLRVEDAQRPLELRNASARGAWVAVEERVPAERRLAHTALSPIALSTERLRAALLDTPSPRLPDDADAPGATRAIAQARGLLAARARAFASDPCVDGTLSSATAAQRALGVAAGVEHDDPVLARCALLRAAALDAANPAAVDALDRWAVDADRPDLLTGFLAWSLQSAERRADAQRWSRLASALDAEGETQAALLARRAAGIDAHPGSDADASTRIDDSESSGLVRLRSDRGVDATYALAAHAPVRFDLPQAGDYRLELRSFADAPAPQWVRLRSGARSWRVALDPTPAPRGTLRDPASGRAPGTALRIDVRAPAATSIVVEPVSGAVLARLDAAMPVQQGSRDATSTARVVRVHFVEAADGVARDAVVDLAVTEPAAPGAVEAPRVPVDIAASMPARSERDAASSAVHWALDALWLLDHGDVAGAQAAASRAMALRAQAPSDADAQPVFSMLEEHVGWEHVEPVASGGRIERRMADGHSSNPLIAERERLAGVADPGRFLLRPGQGWVLDGLQPRQRVRLRLQARAALPGASVDVGLTRGGHRVLAEGAHWDVLDIADATGALHLRVGDALPGTFVALDVASEGGVALDPTHEVAHFRAPVTLRLDAPAWLRVVEWDGRRSRVRTQWVPTAGDVVLRAMQLPGAALRVSRMVVKVPAATASTEAPSRTGAATERAPVPASALSSATAVGMDGASRNATDAAALAISNGASRVATANVTPGALTPALTAAPAPAPAAWPAALPRSGGEDHTWGFAFALRQRLDPDDPIDRRERFGEGTWRYRYGIDAAPLWGRVDVSLRRHDDGRGVIGAAHRLEWRQADGPWGARVDASSWWQHVLGRNAHAEDARIELQWERVRDDRWRDAWTFGASARRQSLSNLSHVNAARVDNDVYSRYRDAHPDQLDIAYELGWRARYDSEWRLSAGATSRRIGDPAIDHADLGAEWRWARNGWAASAGVDARHYLSGGSRAQSYSRTRIDADASKLWLRADHGWRLRTSLGYDTRQRAGYGGVSLEWFDHDGRGLADFGPSEMFLRDVTEADLVGSSPPESAP